MDLLAQTLTRLDLLETKAGTEAELLCSIIQYFEQNREGKQLSTHSVRFLFSQFVRGICKVLREFYGFFQNVLLLLAFFHVEVCL